MSNPIIVGRIVHLTETALDDSPACCAAIITNVHYDDVVDLSYFAPGVNIMGTIDSVKYSKTRESVYTWHWPQDCEARTEAKSEEGA